MIKIDIVGRTYSEFSTKPKGKDVQTTVIAVCNQKGGVGKTTTSINLAASLAESGRKTLLVDFDPQGSASIGLGINVGNLEKTIYDLITNDNTDPKEIIVRTKMPNLDILPASIDLSAAEIQLVNEVSRETILSSHIEKLRGEYDCILIDCQPSLGLLTINALCAADGVLVPLAAEFLALRGVVLLTDTISKIKSRLKPSLEIFGVLITLYNSQTLHSREVATRVYEAFDDILLNTHIPRSVKFQDATLANQSLITYAPNDKVAQNYRQLAFELMEKGFIK